MSAPLIAAPPRVALVLGSGGIKCIATMGLLRVLMSRGIPIDFVVGSSGGSIFAACFGCYPDDYDKIESFLWDYWTPDIFRDFNYWGVLGAMLRPRRASAKAFGIIKGDRIYRNLGKMFPGKRLEDARVPTRIVVTDIAQAAQVVLDRGEVARAVRASVSLPLYMRPVVEGDQILLDGGLSNPLPVDVAAAAGARVIISMGFENASDTPMNHPLNLLNQVIRMRSNHLIRTTHGLQMLTYRGTLIPVHPRFGHHHSFFKFHTMREIIQLGVEATQRALPRIEEAIERLDAPAREPLDPSLPEDASVH
jgi:NTE family protein